jgi:hypothetical protein
LDFTPLPPAARARRTAPIPPRPMSPWLVGVSVELRVEGLRHASMKTPASPARDRAAS